MKNTIRPFVVLVAICLVVGAVLGLTNHITEPIIEKNAADAAAATRLRVLPDAKSFNEIEVKDEWDVDSVHEGIDADGSRIGFVVSAERKGYKSVSVTVGIDAGGNIIGISVDASKETSGIGSKVAEDGYLSQYIGISDSADEVDLIAQATYSSAAVRDCVNAALLAVKSIGGDGE